MYIFRSARIYKSHKNGVVEATWMYYHLLSSKHQQYLYKKTNRAALPSQLHRICIFLYVLRYISPLHREYMSICSPLIAFAPTRVCIKRNSLGKSELKKPHKVELVTAVYYISLQDLDCTRTPWHISDGRIRYIYTLPYSLFFVRSEQWFFPTPFFPTIEGYCDSNSNDSNLSRRDSLFLVIYTLNPVLPVWSILISNNSAGSSCVECSHFLS